MTILISLIGILSICVFIALVEGFTAGWKEAEREWEAQMVEEHRQMLIKQLQRENKH
jgi:hypothetical protein